MKIQILSAETKSKSIPARGDRAAMEFREQQAAILRDDGFPKPFRISIPVNGHPYPPGLYTFDADSFATDEYERLKMGRDLKLVLLPMPVPAKA